MVAWGNIANIDASTSTHPNTSRSRRHLFFRSHENLFAISPPSPHSFNPLYHHDTDTIGAFLNTILTTCVRLALPRLHIPILSSMTTIPSHLIPFPPHCPLLLIQYLIDRSLLVCQPATSHHITSHDALVPHSQRHDPQFICSR